MVATTDDMLYLGIDGGGSKCRAIITNADMTVLGEGLSGPANPLRGMDIATTSVLDATTQALTAAGLTTDDMPRLIAGAGLAGLNVPHYFSLFSAWQHPFHALHLTSDLHIACIGAHSGQDGAVIICGTGSCGLASVNGQLLEIGGHGFPYGDNGSGAWIGMQMLHHVLLSLDQLEQPTALAELLMYEVGATDAISLVTTFMHATPTTYAKYAPLVFYAAQSGDTAAQLIIQQAATHIDNIALRLFSIQPPYLSMIGGVAAKLIPFLSPAVQSVITPAQQAPEFGAIWFAQQCQRNNSTVMST